MLNKIKKLIEEFKINLKTNKISKFKVFVVDKDTINITNGTMKTCFKGDNFEDIVKHIKEGAKRITEEITGKKIDFRKKGSRVLITSIETYTSPFIKIYKSFRIVLYTFIFINTIIELVNAFNGNSFVYYIATILVGATSFYFIFLEDIYKDVRGYLGALFIIGVILQFIYG